MAPNSWVPTQSLQSQLNKRNETEISGGGGGNNAAPGLVLSALALLVTILAYRHERHRGKMSIFPTPVVNARLPLTCSPQSY